VYAAYLAKLKGFFGAAPEEKSDLVLSCPPYLSAVERQAILDACRVANVNCLKLTNENTAVALSYGFFRRKEFDAKKQRYVAFVDFGHGKLTATIASFTQNKLKIVSHRSDRNIGARNIDELLADRLGAEFLEKYGCDPRTSPRSLQRMLVSIEKARKTLSANNEADINVECLMEDEDLARHIFRGEFEELIEGDIKRMKELV
jgi:heat shock protein 4